MHKSESFASIKDKYVIVYNSEDVQTLVSHSNLDAPLESNPSLSLSSKLRASLYLEADKTNPIILFKVNSLETFSWFI